MNPTPTAPTQRDPLRALLAGADPTVGDPTALPEDVWARIADDVTGEAAEPAGPGAQEPGWIAAGPAHPSTTLTQRRSFAGRHWQSGLLVAAGLASLALAAGTVLPGLVGSGADSGRTTTESAPAAEDSAAASDDSAGSTDAGAAGRSAVLQRGAAAAREGAADSADSAPAATKDPTLVRSGSVIVGTDDIQGGRDSFVADVQRMGGTVMSETVTTQGDDALAAKERASVDDGITYPYPSPSGPGIALTVKVPSASFDQAMAAARATGEVAQLQQSSYDVGTQITDVRARIAVLTASLKRLEGLMDDAKSVSDVIRLEKAIADRQSELDSLLAQQRELADQTEMSQVSLTLMSPEDARGAVEPEPQLTWWESFVKGLGQFWSWLGQALLIVSPLLIVLALLWWLRRRRATRSTAQPDPGATPETT